jgi:hypothetical protein
MENEVAGQAILDKLEGERKDNDVVVIAHTDVDITQVESIWVGQCEDAWSAMINAKLEDGFTILQIQTEWTIESGHKTIIYMVKLKPEE